MSAKIDVDKPIINDILLINMPNVEYKHPPTPQDVERAYTEDAYRIMLKNAYQAEQPDVAREIQDLIGQDHTPHDQTRGWPRSSTLYAARTLVDLRRLAYDGRTLPLFEPLFATEYQHYPASSMALTVPKSDPRVDTVLALTGIQSQQWKRVKDPGLQGVWHEAETNLGITVIKVDHGIRQGNRLALLARSSPAQPQPPRPR